MNRESFGNGGEGGRESLGVGSGRYRESVGKLGGYAAGRFGAGLGGVGWK